MLKTLCAIALVTSTLSVGPAFAAASQAPKPAGSTVVAAAHTLPWCSAHVKTHCRHHVHKAAPKAM